MNRKTQSYRRGERNNYIKIAVVLAITVAIAYYGFMGIKCFKHCQSLMNNRTATINFNIIE